MKGVFQMQRVVCTYGAMKKGFADLFFTEENCVTVNLKFLIVSAHS